MIYEIITTANSTPIRFDSNEYEKERGFLAHGIECLKFTRIRRPIRHLGNNVTPPYTEYQSLVEGDERYVFYFPLNNIAQYTEMHKI
jgi:hypothetical protein